MNRPLKLFATLLLAVLLPVTLSQATQKTPLDAFPEAQPGAKRFVIELPHKTRKEETRFGVELLVGQTMETDGVNQVMLAGEIQPRPLKGWGYTYYEASGSLLQISTLMGVNPDQPRVTRFVHTAPLRIPYNSRLPVVVYVPESYEVRYRIWSAPETYQAAHRN